MSRIFSIVARSMVAAACASIFMVSDLPAAELPDSTIPNTFGVQIKGHNKATADIERVHQLGMKFIRRGFIWESVEKAPGEYDWSDYDRIVKDCRERGISIIGCIAFSHKAYGHAKDEKGRAGYAAFAAAAAERYKDDKIYWEIWNEPNTMTFWGRHGGKGNTEPYAEEYYQLVKAVVPAMRKADPDCYIMGGSVSGLWTESWKWQQFAFEKGILKTGIDAWSVHPYAFKSPEDYGVAYAQLRKMIVDAGGSAEFPILNTERGFPIGKAEGYAGGDEKLSHEYQAWHVVRQYLIDMHEGIKLTIWYEWSGKEGFELLKNGEETPAYKSTQVLIRELSGYKLDKRLPTENARDFVFQFKNASGGVKLVAWAAPPYQQSPDKIVEHEIKIPVDATGSLETTDLYGKRGTVAIEGGSITLTVNGAPQYITVVAR